MIDELYKNGDLLLFELHISMFLLIQERIGGGGKGHVHNS